MSWRDKFLLLTLPRRSIAPVRRAFERKVRMSPAAHCGVLSSLARLSCSG